jgi:hypothetical protein
MHNIRKISTIQPAEMFNKQTLSYATLHLYELLPRCKSEPTGANEGSSQAECTGKKKALKMRLKKLKLMKM